MYTPKNKPRKDIWHPKAQTENLITKYTAKGRKKDVAKEKKNRLEVQLNSTKKQLGFRVFL